MPIAQIDGTVTGSVSAMQEISGTLAHMGTVSGTITVGGAGDLPEYDGPYEVTPTTEAQTLATANTAVTDNIIIHPIPPNYGLISWNGSTLTVS